MSIMKLATYFVLLGALAGAQSPPISFDAASIKVNNSGERRTSMRSLPGGRVEGTNRTLKLLIQWAFDLLPVQIAGGPAWIESDRFDISATANAAVTPEQMHAMMRTLLADRFKLASHAETQQLPIYAMRLARADGRLGSALKKAAEDAKSRFRENDGSLATERTTMAALAKELTGYAGRPVVDETGLSGEWALTVNWTPDAGGDASLPSIFTAMREQLGLKLEPTRGPVDVLVIDRAERPAAD
jgi:uncharacterized protein (TIGR03435 family)